MANQTSTYSGGIATAYGAALRGGYTGTYAEFCAQQAQYAENAAAVAQAKEDAQAAATAAGQQAAAAGQSATAAAGSATAAAGSAGDAAGSATAAAGSATAASGKASEAAASATAAGQAQTAAETAQTAAEDAQAAAEAAAQTLVIDPTLTQPNQAAEAKATGDAINAVNVQLGAALIVNEASGAVASFADGSDGVPVEGLTVGIEPIQSGSGDPSPDNVRPISGWTEVTVTRTAENIFGGTLMRDGVKASMPNAADHPDDGYIQFASNTTSTKAITTDCGLTGRFKENTQYTFIITYEKATGSGSSNMRIIYTDGTYTYIPSVSKLNNKVTNVVVSNAGKTVGYFNKINQSGTTRLYYNESGIFEGILTAEDFVPYNGQSVTVQLGDTIYGGSLDVTTGVLTVDSQLIQFTGDEASWTKVSATSGGNSYYRVSRSSVTAWDDTEHSLCSHFPKANIASSTKDFGFSPNNSSQFGSVVAFRPDLTTYSTLADWKAYLAEQYANGTPVTVWCKTANTVTVQLDAQTLSTLKGQNNIWSDTGDVSVDYVADTKLYIDRLTGSDVEMIADANITTGQYFMVGNALFLATANIESGGTIVPGTNCTKTNLAEALNALNA